MKNLILLFLVSLVFSSCGAPAIGIFFLPFQIVDDEMTFEPADELQIEGGSVKTKISVSGESYRFKFPNEIHEVGGEPSCASLQIEQTDGAFCKIRFDSCELFSACGKTDLLALVSYVDGFGFFDEHSEAALSREEEENLTRDFKDSHTLSFFSVPKRRLVIKDLPDGNFTFEEGEEEPLYINKFLVHTKKLPIDLNAEDSAKIEWTATLFFADGTQKTVSRKIDFVKKTKSVKMYHPIFNRHPDD